MEDRMRRVNTPCDDCVNVGALSGRWFPGLEKESDTGSMSQKKLKREHITLG